MNSLMTLTMIIMNVIKTTGDCPRSCECKWKSGKESVFCVNANITEIPKHLDSGTQVLVLTGNKLQKIEADEFSNASLLNLQKVFLSRCKLRSIDRSSFRKIINLVELDLSYNDLRSVPSHTFEFIKELRELRLNGNPIVRLLNYAFKMVPRLTKLDLSECRIAYVEIKAFQGLENSLEWLKLDKNKIMNIKPQALVNLCNLHGLELSGNFWNCSCGLRTLREWMLRQNVPYSVPPICKHPPRLAGKVWDKLGLDEFACTPKIEAVMPQKNGEEGSNVTLSCSVTGIPEPNVRWLRKNHFINNLSSPVSNVQKKVYIVQITNQTSNLTISTADTQDNGIYICQAENKAGRSEANITLTVTLKRSMKIWSQRVIIAVGVVFLLFATAVGLLIYCAWSLNKRKSYVAHSVNRRQLLNSYEMKHKNPTGYNIIRNYGNHCSSDTNDNVNEDKDRSTQSLEFKIQTANVKRLDRRESTDFLDLTKADKMERSFLKKSETEYKQNESCFLKLSPDLNISRLSGPQPHRFSSQSNGSYSDDSSFEHLMAYTNFCNSEPQYLNLKTIPKNSFFMSSSSSEEHKKFPDLLEISRNEENVLNNNLFSAAPKKKSHKIKRTQDESFGSESQSPLLPESSEDSCESNHSRSVFDRYISLPSSANNLFQTPILDILDGSSNFLAQSPTTLNYRAWELEKFLKEYRNLQGHLYRMNVSCENLKQDNLKFRKSENASNAVESATISKMISPIYLENSCKTNFYDRADRFESFCNKNEYLKEGNNNPASILKTNSSVTNGECYWSSPSSENGFYKS